MRDSSAAAGSVIVVDNLGTSHMMIDVLLLGRSPAAARSSPVPSLGSCLQLRKVALVHVVYSDPRNAIMCRPGAGRSSCATVFCIMRYS